MRWFDDSWVCFNFIIWSRRECVRGKRSSFHYFPNAPSTDQARLKPGTKNSIQVTLLGDKQMNTYSITCCLWRCSVVELDWPCKLDLITAARCAVQTSSHLPLILLKCCLPLTFRQDWHGGFYVWFVFCLAWFSPVATRTYMFWYRLGWGQRFLVQTHEQRIRWSWHMATLF